LKTRIKDLSSRTEIEDFRLCRHLSYNKQTNEISGYGPDSVATCRWQDTCIIVCWVVCRTCRLTTARLRPTVWSSTGSRSFEPASLPTQRAALPSTASLDSAGSTLGQKTQISGEKPRFRRLCSSVGWVRVCLGWGCHSSGLFVAQFSYSQRQSLEHNKFFP